MAIDGIKGGPYALVAIDLSVLTTLRGYDGVYFDWAENFISTPRISFLLVPAGHPNEKLYRTWAGKRLSDT